MGLHSVFKGLCSLLVGHILWHCLHICQEKGQKHCKSDSTEEFDIFFCNLEMLFRSLLIAIYKMCWKLKEQGWTPAYVSSQHKKIFFTDLKHLIYTHEGNYRPSIPASSDGTVLWFIQKNPTRCSSVSKFIVPYLYEAQHVSGDTPPVIRSLKLHWQPLVLHTWRVVGHVVAGRCSVQQPQVQQPSMYAKPEAASAVLGSWWRAVCRPKHVELHTNMEQ